MPERDAVEWLRMMEAHAPIAASTRATMGRIAAELEQLRAEVAALRSPPPLRPAARAA